MTLEPRSALSAALNDPSRWIRIGAARAALRLAPGGAAEMLAERAAALGDSLPADETSIIAVALAHAGGDPLPLAAKLLRGNVADLQSALDGDYDQWAGYVNERIRTNSLQERFRPLEYFYAARRHGRLTA
jgi:hypothetical protein